MGGASRHLPPFLAALHAVRPGWSISLWVTSGHEPSSVSESVSVHSVPRGRVWQRLWWESIRLPRALRADDADALINLTNSGPLLGSVPSVLYQRNSLWFDPDWAGALRGRARVEAVARRQLAYLQMRRSAVVIVPSAAMGRFLLSWPGAPRSCALRVVPHAVDSDRFSLNRRPWPPPQGRPIQLVSVSHAAPHKDQMLLVRLLDRLRDDGLQARLWLTIDHADSPRYFEQIVQLCKELHLEQQVDILGRVEDVSRLYREADIMVFPSRTESFGFPVAEGMASGIPVVASGTAASRELLGSSGWFFPPGDVDAAAAMVHQVLGTSAKRLSERLTRAAQAAQGLTWVENATQVATAIEEAGQFGDERVG